tara:strand:+ start:4308 stop:5987 length:1680 start_codon:yes stop_codon:yes gene_type:complete
MDFLKVPKQDTKHAEEILKRYDAANSDMQTWLSTLQNVYSLVLPNKAKFSVKDRTPGQSDYTAHVYDWTAVIGAEQYASNLIANLMPSGTNWFELSVGRKHKGQQADAGKGTQDLLAHMTKTIFDVLNSSNFYQSVHQSLMEMSISTGVLLVNETADIDHPLTFTSVPLHECCFEAGPSQEIQNVYRKFELEGHAMLGQWPKAKWSQSVLDIIKDDPKSKFTVIESTVKHTDKPIHKEWCYSVVLQDTSETALIEYRSYSPFITFRPMVYSGELLGRGVMLNMISAIRTLNRLAEDELRLNAYMAKPIFMSPSGSGAINPYMVKIQPGCIIPYQADAASNRPPIEQLTIQGNLQYTQVNSQQIKSELVRALGVNPVQPDGNAQETATRTQLLNEDWIKRNQEMFGRLTPELCTPLIKTVFHILHRMGYWKMPIIDGQIIDIEFTSPIMDTQKKQNVSRMMQYAQALQQTVGPQEALTAFAYGIDITEYPTWLAEQLNIDSPIRRGDLSKSAMMSAAKQQMQMQGQQQQPQPTTPGGFNGQQQGLPGQQPAPAAGAGAGV